MKETKYYQVKVQIERVVDEKTKVSTENYIVEAINCTDAEKIIYDYFNGTTENFKVKSINETNIIDILSKDSIA